MRPVLFRIPDWIPLIGDQPVTAFGVLLLVAFIAAGALFAHRLRGGAPEARAWEIVTAAVLGGVVAAKLLHLAVHGALGLPTAGFGRGGLNWLGGLAGGTAVAVWAGRRQGVRSSLVLGAAAAPVALGYAIGRVGSFLVGADYGAPTSLPWGVPFPAGTPPSTPLNLEAVYGRPVPEGARWGDFVRVHPTQLYAAALSLVTAGLLEWLRVRRPGWWGVAGGWRLFGVFLILHGCGRIAVELLRAKQDHLFGAVTVDMILAALVAAAGAALIRAARP